MSPLIQETGLRLIKAATALFAARAHEVVTSVEWQDFRDALSAYIERLQQAVSKPVAPCPGCDRPSAGPLFWQDEFTVRCPKCGRCYDPDARQEAGHAVRRP